MALDLNGRYTNQPNYTFEKKITIIKNNKEISASVYSDSTLYCFKIEYLENEKLIQIKLREKDYIEFIKKNELSKKIVNF